MYRNMSFLLKILGTTLKVRTGMVCTQCSVKGDIFRRSCITLLCAILCSSKCWENQAATIAWKAFLLRGSMHKHSTCILCVVLGEEQKQKANKVFAVAGELNIQGGLVGVVLFFFKAKSWNISVIFLLPTLILFMDNCKIYMLYPTFNCIFFKDTCANRLIP